MAYSYEHLLNAQNLASGIAEQVFLSPVNWMTSIKGTTTPESVVISASHQFAAGKGFLIFQLAPERNSYDAKTVGDRGSQKLEHELKIFIPGSYEQAHNTVKHLLNEPLIVLHKDGACEEKICYQFGNQTDYAWLKADFSTGTTKDGTKGYAATVSFMSDSLLIYTGLIKRY